MHARLVGSAALRRRPGRREALRALHPQVVRATDQADERATDAVSEPASETATDQATDSAVDAATYSATESAADATISRFSKILSTEAPCRPSISAVPRSWATNRVSRTIYASRTTTSEVTHRPGLTQSPRNPRGQLVVFRKIIKIHRFSRFMPDFIGFWNIEKKLAYMKRPTKISR